MPRSNNNKIIDREKFEKFHEAHPEVGDLFQHYCLEMIASGRTRFGAPVIWERMRWETLKGSKDGPYRLPNALRPYYARKFKEEHPEHAHHVTTRPMKEERR